MATNACVNTEQTLRAGLAQLELKLSDEQIAKLLAYCALLQKWNKTYNLTAVDTPQGILTHHLLDSLSIILLLQKAEQEILDGPGAEAESAVNVAPSHSESPLPQVGEGEGARLKLLDVGSGGGLPGVVIAICCPGISVTCVDAVAKKTAFIQQAALQLQLPNLQSRHARVETISEPFDVITSRAFATLLDFTSWTQGALGAQGLWLAMKGKHPAEEIAALPVDVKVMRTEPLTVPGLDAQRCLVFMRRASSCPLSPWGEG